MNFLCISLFFQPFVLYCFFIETGCSNLLKHYLAEINHIQSSNVKIFVVMWITLKIRICIGFVHKFTKLSDNLVPRKPTSPMNSCSERGLSFRDHHCHYECGDGGCCGDTASDCRICRSYISQNGTTCLPQCPSDFTNRVGSFAMVICQDLVEFWA